MANSNYTQTHYDADHIHFGGRVFSGDFGYKTSLADIAGRIAADLAFDRFCEKNTLDESAGQTAERTEK